MIEKHLAAFSMRLFVHLVDLLQPYKYKIIIIYYIQINVPTLTEISNFIIITS